MQLINRYSALRICLWLFVSLFSLPLMALKSDRQMPLEVYADNTNGFLGDGVTTLTGKVDVRQGSLHITADEAEVAKAEGRVKSVSFHGHPAFLEQEIEEQGLVTATASSIDYQVASGLVTLTGNADVIHPQYRISGDLLTYDLNIQHFEGNSDEGSDGRVRIQLDPELIDKAKNSQEKSDKSDTPVIPEQGADEGVTDEDEY